MLTIQPIADHNYYYLILGNLMLPPAALVMYAVQSNDKNNYLRVVPPPPREEELPPPPPEVRIVPPVDERIVELPLEERTEVLLERVLVLLLLDRIVEEELLLVRFTEGVVERVAVETLDTRLVVAVERTGVASLLLERVVEDTEALREDVVDVLSTREREVVGVAALLREAAARTLLLPKVRDVSAMLRLDTRVVAGVPTADERLPAAERIAAWRFRSISRALV